MELPIKYQFLIPMLLQLGGIFICMVYYRATRRAKPIARKAGIYRCTSCKHIYVDTRQVPATSCPRCRTLNDVIKR